MSGAFVRASALALPLLLAVTAVRDRRPEPGPSVPRREPTLRVLLTGISDRVRIRVPGAYRLLDARSGRPLEKGHDLDRELDVRSPSVSTPLRLVADDGAFAVDRRHYPGALLIRPGGSGLTLVDEVPLERYLPGVLAGELGASYPAASLRAQAVASRSYAVYEKLHVAPDAPYDVTDDTRSQVYRPVSGAAGAPLRTAVRDTRGVVLTYEGRVIPAYFHSTCGGHTAPAQEVFGGPVVPPLAGVPCPYCKDAPYYRWTADVPAGEAERRLRLDHPISKATVVKRGPFGRALSVELEAGGRLVLPATEFRRRLGASTLRSTLLLSLSVTGGELVARGGGFGHGVGMCQMGAVGMAEDHAGAGDILAQYYPTAELTRIY